MFRIIDKTTGKEVSEEVIDQLIDEYGLDKNDIEGFAVTYEGQIILCDECGRYGYLNQERFKAEFEMDEIAISTFGNLTMVK